MPKLCGKITVKRLAGLAKIVPGGSGSGGGKMQEKSVTPSTSAQVVTPDSGFSGMSRVNVGAVTLQDKAVAPATSAQVVKADDGSMALGTVTVGAAPLQAKTFRPSTENQIVTPDDGFYGLSSVEALGLNSTTEIDFANYYDGSFTETLSDDSKVVHTVEFDSSGVPVSVDGILLKNIQTDVEITGVE